MAELVLSTIGQAVGSRLSGVLGTIGGALGQAGGAMLGRAIDQQLFGETRRYEGARLTDFHLQGSTEGASIPAVYGRVRIAGQVIWAARFKERAVTEEIDTGGKGGGPSATSTTYAYSLSFAVGLCEGEIARIGRVWANGEAFDLSQCAWRLHRGSELQEPDPLIETIEGADAPAYRELAYIVFEDLPLAQFGNRIPQLSFEIMRATPEAGLRFEERVNGVCLIPGAGEFVYATQAVMRRMGPGQEIAENVHAEQARANLLVSLDQLEADFPNCETVLLVVAWFGDDLRCGECSIRPGVEIADKVTTPLSWRVSGADRDDAYVVSQHEGAPAYGGTPSDVSVRQAIVELKARGYKVGLYPFVLMDVPQGNVLPDPYGGAAQAAYPWRGRITLHPAAGESGSPDKTGAATAQVEAFFGAAEPSDFGAGAANVPSYSGPSEWSYRRFILHYAKLAALANGVDAFIIGSEMRGLTTARDGAASYPAVEALREIAADVRAVLPETTLTYAADWSEYFGHQPQDGSGDVFFHLDPLWSDANIDAVGIDWYPPLTDWRDGANHLDAALSRRIHDGVYLESRIEAGENFDWFYASDADRSGQLRTPISDGAYDEPWIFRAKDVRNFWSRAHYNRPGGVRAGTPTDWIAESKPIWFVELGCPAIDKGSNAPNLFTDAKSDESAAPYFSSGARDDLIQRRTLEAYLRYWGDAENNPVSSATGERMLMETFLWAWDTRPYPAFPARSDVWADGASWRLGHWLNGRAGLSSLTEIVTHICARAGVDVVDTSSLLGAVGGYIVDAPLDARSALEPLMAAYDFAAVEREGALVFFHRHEAEPNAIALEAFSADSIGEAFATRGDGADAPVEARVRFIDGERDYLIGAASARRVDRAEGGVASIDAPLVLDTDSAEALAQRLLSDRRAANEMLQIGLGPAHMALEPGDAIIFGEAADTFEIVRIDDAEHRRLELRRARASLAARVSAGEPGAPTPPALAPTPAFAVLDLPLLPGFEEDERPLAAIFASPWRGAHHLHAGVSLTRRASVTQPAIMGELAWALWPGPVDRWDDGNVVRVTLYGGALASAEAGAVLNGANIFAIDAGDSDWEIVQARSCVLVAPNTYELSGFLRGQLGSAHAIRAPHPVGARIVKLDARLARCDVGAHEWGEALDFAAPPFGLIASDDRAATDTLILPRAAVRPWAPAHVRARRVAGGDVEISWVRCARSGGDAWGAGEPPLGALTESYRLHILDGAVVKRSVTVGAPAYTYTSADQTADFGAPPGSLQVRVSQVAENGGEGLNKELTITL